MDHGTTPPLAEAGQIYFRKSQGTSSKSREAILVLKLCLGRLLEGRCSPRQIGSDLGQTGDDGIDFPNNFAEGRQCELSRVTPYIYVVLLVREADLSYSGSL